MSANFPEFGDVLGWAESSAVIYANSVIGARAKRNSIMVDACVAVTGLTPDFELLHDEHQRGEVLIKLDIDEMDDDALGFVIGESIVDCIPVLTQYPFDQVQLKNLGASMAASGGITMFHVEGLTPECPSLDAAFDGAPAETNHHHPEGHRLDRPAQAESGMVVFGCPQMTLNEVEQVGQHFVGKQVSRKTLFISCRAIMRRCASCRFMISWSRRALNCTPIAHLPG